MAFMDGGYNMAHRPAIPRPDPEDNPPTERARISPYILRAEEYHMLKGLGFTDEHLDSLCETGGIHSVLAEARRPVEPTPPPSREYPTLSDPLVACEAKERWKIRDTHEAHTHKVPSGYSVMNTVALKRALTKDSLPDAIDRLKDEMVETIREELKTKDSLETAKQLVDRAINIRVSTSQSTHFDPDGDRRYEDRVDGHPGQLNRFMLDVAANGGNIVSIVAVEKQVVLVHYKIPNDVKITLDTMQSR